MNSHIRERANHLAQGLTKLQRKVLRRLDTQDPAGVDEDALQAYLMPTFTLTMGEDWWEQQGLAAIATVLLLGLVETVPRHVVREGAAVTILGYVFTDLGKEVFRAQVRVWGWEDANRR